MAGRKKAKKQIGFVDKIIQMPLPGLLPRSDWKPTPLGQLPSWRDAKRISLDVETRDPDLYELGCGVRRPGTYVVGMSFAIEDGPAHYLPFRHPDSANVDEAKGWGYLKDQLASFSGVITGAGLAYDLDWLMEKGLTFTQQHSIRDIQVAQPILNEHQHRYRLDVLAEQYGLEGKDEFLLREAAAFYGVDPKKGLFLLPSQYVGVYAERDAYLPLQILRKQEKLIAEEELDSLYAMECKLTPILVKMRRRGVRVDVDKLEMIQTRALREEKQALEKIRYLTGVEIAVGDVWKKEALARALDVIGAPYPKTSQGKPSISKEVLASVNHPVAAAINDARKWNGIRCKFGDGLLQHVINGRVHGTLNQLKKDKDKDADGRKNKTAGTVSGRLSGEDPNMQNQPIRDLQIGKVWRSIYLPEEGEEWCSSDYSQQEPRITVHYAEALNLPGAREAGDRYRTNPKADFHQMMADMTGLDRKYAKNIFLGLVYSMGGALLCKNLGLPTKWITSRRTGQTIEVAGPEGQKILDQFNEAVPFARGLAKKCEARAKERGFIVTLAGRRCRFPKLPNGRYDWTHIALNRLIQGSAADQTKIALIAVEEAGLRPLLQVHDEIDTSVPNRKVAHEIENIMTNVVQLSVPSKVDTEIGVNWGEIKEVAFAA